MNTSYGPTRITPEIDRLNNILAQELGRTPSGEPIFKFEWTEDLFWPLYRTGRMIQEKVTHEVPIIGGGTDMLEEIKVVPEYTRSRMTHTYTDQWIITSWIPEEGLTQWAQNFAGCDFPSQGYRVCTNYVVPQGDRPSIDDVRHFCAGVRFNRSHSQVGLTQKLNDEYDKLHPMPVTNPEEYNRNSEVGAAIAENFNAFMNPEPGKRGGSVSIGGIGANPVSKRKVN